MSYPGVAGSVGAVRTIVSGVKHTLGGWRGNDHFFTPPILCPNTPPPLLAGFLLALLSVDYWGFRDAHTDPSLPYRNHTGG